MPRPVQHDAPRARPAQPDLNTTPKGGAGGRDRIDPDAVLMAVWRDKWLIMGVAAICVVLGGFYAYRIATPVYRSTAVVLHEVQQPLMDFQGALGGFAGDSSEMNSELEVLRARGLVRDVVLKHGLVADPEFNETLRDPDLMAKLKAWVSASFGTPDPANAHQTGQEAAEQEINTVISAVRNNLSVRNVPNSLVFEVSFHSEDPRKAAQLTDAVVAAYLNRQIEMKFDSLQQAVEWLSSRVAELQIQLEVAEQERATFSSATDLVSIEGLRGLERQLKDLRERIADQEVLIAQMDEGISGIGSATSRAGQAELTGDRTLIRLAGALDTGEATAETFDARLALVTRQAQRERDRLALQHATLEASAANLSIEIDLQNADLIRLQQLSREAESIRLLYETFLTRLNETAAQQGVQSSDSVVLSNAVVARFPVSPRKSLFLGTVGVLGVMLGLLVVLIREARSRGFRTAPDLERAVGLAVVGQIPLIPARGRRKVLSYIKDKPASDAAEAIRNLRTGLMYSDSENPPQVVMVTSSVPAEGKTMTAIALALNLAATGKKVLLVEGDMRRRTFNAYFPSLKGQGLVSVLAGDARLQQAVQRVPDFDFDILAGEESRLNPADLYASEGFAALIEEMRASYDVIVIDTPPVLVVPDARIIANAADASILCVKWDSTSDAQVDETMRLFDGDKTPITGLALTQINRTGMRRYGYGGRSGVHGPYGAQYYSN